MEFLRAVTPHVVRVLDTRLDAAREHFFGSEDPPASPELPPDVHSLIASKIQSRRDLASYASAARITHRGVSDAGRSPELRGAAFFQRALKIREHALPESERSEGSIEMIRGAAVPGGELTRAQHLRAVAADTNNYNPYSFRGTPKSIAAALDGSTPGMQRKLVAWATNADPLTLHLFDERAVVVGAIGRRAEILSPKQRAAVVRAALATIAGERGTKAIGAIAKKAEYYSEAQQRALIDAAFDLRPIYKKMAGAGKIASRLQHFSPLTREHFWTCLTREAPDWEIGRFENYAVQGGVADVISSLSKSIAELSEHEQRRIADAVCCMPGDRMRQLLAVFGKHLAACHPEVQNRLVSFAGEHSPGMLLRLVHFEWNDYLQSVSAARQLEIYDAAIGARNGGTIADEHIGSVVRAFAPVMHALPEDVQFDMLSRLANASSVGHKATAQSGLLVSRDLWSDAGLEAVLTIIKRMPDSQISKHAWNFAPVLHRFSAANQIAAIDTAASLVRNFDHREALATIAQSFGKLAKPAQLHMLQVIDENIDAVPKEALTNVARSVVDADDEVQRAFFALFARVRTSQHAGEIAAAVMPSLSDVPDAEYQRLLRNIPAANVDAWVPWLRRRVVRYILTDPTVYPQLVMLGVSALRRATGI